MIRICASSSSVKESMLPRLDKALSNFRGYETVETTSVRRHAKCACADAKTRASDFLSLYKNLNVTAIVPP